MIRKGYSLIFFSVIFFSCTKNYSTKEHKIYSACNRFSSLENHYTEPGDSLKRKALSFILKNLSDQYHYGGSRMSCFRDIISKKHIASSGALNSIWDSMSRNNIGIFHRINDCSVLSERYVINNIDEAFQAKQLPWAKDVSFEDFCEMVLPYKSSNEEPEVWRAKIRHQYQWVIDSMNGNTDKIKCINLINSDLKTWFRISLTNQFPVETNYSMAKMIKIGTCSNSSGLGLYIFRAFGLPVATDFVPCWANRHGNHNWNVLIVNHRLYTFNSAEAGIGYHKVQFIGVGRMLNKEAKIFRRTFSIQKTSLLESNPGLEKDDIPDLFNNSRIFDVTSNYVPVVDVHIVLPDSMAVHQILYLSVFDNKSWVPVSWGRQINHSVIFKDMGKGVLYLGSTYQHKTNIGFGSPFCIGKYGELHLFEANMQKLRNVTLYRKYPEDESNKIEPKDLYELFYWQYGWKSLGRRHSSTGKIIYKNAPNNCVFVLRDLTKGFQERVFTYDNGKQIWW